VTVYRILLERAAERDLTRLSSEMHDRVIVVVLTYIRSTWGNNAQPVKPEQVAAARKDIHPGPMTSPELQQIPVQ
jgi:hypothetical protein